MSETPRSEEATDEQWNFERAERRPGLRSTRMVVSVSFPRQDFERVAASAEELGQRISEFIRAAALEKAARQQRLGLLASYSSSYGSALFVPIPPATTRVSGSARAPEPAAVTS